MSTLKFDKKWAIRDGLQLPSLVQSRTEPLVTPGTSEFVIVMTDSRSLASLACLYVCSGFSFMP